jgi:hypothetical protein
MGIAGRRDGADCRNHETAIRDNGAYFCKARGAMTTERQRHNELAVRLCQEWQERQRPKRPFTLGEISAFIAGVVAAKEATALAPHEREP